MAERTKRMWGSHGKASLSLLVAMALAATGLSLIPGTSSSALTQTFSNPTPIVISQPNGGPPGGEVGCPSLATPYNNSCKPAAALPWPSPITVSGVTGPVTDVNVNINGLWHREAPADIDMLLVGPDGTTMIILMSDDCGTSNDPTLNPIPQANAINITFSDGAPGIPQDGVCTSTTYAPVDDDIILNPDGTPVDGYTDNFQFQFTCCDSFAGIAPPPQGPPPAPQFTVLPAPTVIPPDPNELVSLTVFNSINPNGTWNLYMVDDTPGSPSAPVEGGITNGWSIEFTTAGTATPIGVFRPSNSTWYIQGNPAVAFGTTGDIQVPGDYDGNGSTDIAVFRPSNGVWYVQGGSAVAWGASGDIPVPADYDGNGTTDRAVFRPSTGVWYVQGGPTVAWGTSGDIPVPGDYDGDGDDTIGVFRPSTSTWYIQGGPTVAWGTSGDIPVPGNYDGNTTTDIAVFRPSNGTWYVQGGPATAWGTSGDIPVPGDYDGNGTTDLAVFRPSTGVWFVMGGTTVAFGTAGDRPLPLPYAIQNAFFP